MKHYFVIFFISLFTTLNSQAIIPFDNPNPGAPTICNDTWVESGIPQQILMISGVSNCAFDYSAGHLWLYPAILNLDLSSLSNIITSVEIDLVDACGGCGIVEFFENGNIVGSTNSTNMSNVQTVVYVNSAMDIIDEMTFEGYENQLLEIRIFTEPNCSDPIEAEIWLEDGDIYLEDACNGIILTSPNGNCYRVTVNDVGGLETKLTVCP